MITFLRRYLRNPYRGELSRAARWHSDFDDAAIAASRQFQFIAARCSGETYSRKVRVSLHPGRREMRDADAEQERAPGHEWFKHARPISDRRYFARSLGMVSP